jgi:(1->4)-alpha-D-glucan 1-alpha-D-glucosylmutase
MHDLLASDANRLTELMMSICERHRHYRDYTRHEVNEALRELIACLPVYRSYVRAEAKQVREEDRKIVTGAVDKAKTFRPELDPGLFDFLRGLLLLEYRGQLETEFVMRFQQLTGPAAAKGVEDTAFYCFNRLLSLNEVGGDPSRFGVSVETFHQAMAEAMSRRPHSMLTTSTHDTKRSEDVRARLALLSEIPQKWIDAVRRWADRNERHRQDNTPDRNAEYLLYQTLVGAWPIETERVLTFMTKAVREAKTHTSWTRPEPAYEEALGRFVANILEDPEFRSDLEGFVSPIVGRGRINSLSQLLIKLSAPGVPDFYQGPELWDLSLVDPDNRRPVDFALRRRLFTEVEGLSPAEILARMDEGLPKLWVIRQALGLRKRLPGHFASADYRPLIVQGNKAVHAVAFCRGEEVVTVVPRLVYTLQEAWGNTWLELTDGIWHNELTGDRVKGGRLKIEEILDRFPVALLSRQCG